MDIYSIMKRKIDIVERRVKDAMCDLCKECERKGVCHFRTMAGTRCENYDIVRRALEDYIYALREITKEED